MNTPTWLKPAGWGLGVGIAATTIIGFSWGGWMTAGDADEMAQELADDAVVAAQEPICVAQANEDTKFADKWQAVQEATSYKRRDALAATGWATMPGSETADRNVTQACLKALEKEHK